MTKGGPGDYSKTVPMQMLDVGFRYNEFGYAAAIGVLFTILVGFIIFISMKMIRGTFMSIKRWDSALLIRIILFMLAALTLYPVLFTVFTSLKTSDEFYSNLWSIPSQFHYENYVEAFQTARLGDYMGNSIMIAVLSLFTCSVLATFAAYSLARLRVPFAGAIVGVLFLLQILPGESMIIPLYMMMTKLAIFKVIYLPIVIAYLGWMLPGTIVILWNFFARFPTNCWKQQESTAAAR